MTTCDCSMGREPVHAIGVWATPSMVQWIEADFKVSWIIPLTVLQPEKSPLIITDGRRCVGDGVRLAIATALPDTKPTVLVIVRNKTCREVGAVRSIQFNGKFAPGRQLIAIVLLDENLH